MNLLTDEEKLDLISAAKGIGGARPSDGQLLELIANVEAAVLEKVGKVDVEPCCTNWKAGTNCFADPHANCPHLKVDVEPVNDWVLAYAKTIANCLWADHYKDDAPQWKVLPDLAGVLSQIDNMVSGLVPASALAALQAENERLEKELSATNEYLWATEDDLISLRHQLDDEKSTITPDVKTVLQAITDPENQPSQYDTVTLSMYDALRAENERLRVDAERYQWLRELPNADSLNIKYIGSDLDMVIDAALEGTK